MDVHLVIPTYNPDYRNVNKLISSIERQSYRPKSVTFVENGSETAWLIQRCEHSKQLCYERSGLGANKARNHGAAGKSGLLVFTDDDCVLDDDFITSHLLVHKRYPNSIVGGKVRLDFREGPPDWLICGFRKSLAELCFEEDYNVLGLERYIEESEYLVTANMSCSAALFGELGGFDEEMGYVGDMLAPNDEHIFLATAMMNDIGCIYSSTALVHHDIPPHRMKMEYFRRRYFGQGFADALLSDKMGSLFSVDIKPTSACLTDVFLKGAVAGQVRHAEKQDQDQDLSPAYTDNLLICSAEYVKGVLEYEKRIHPVRCQNGEPTSSQSACELKTGEDSPA
jgi:glycosyltransferase involved in cell wall biosynthesis